MRFFSTIMTSSVILLSSNTVADVDRLAVFFFDASLFEMQTGQAGDAFDLTFQYPLTRTGFSFVSPLAGDWDGDGFDTIGAFDHAAARFHLRDQNLPGADDHVFVFGTTAKGIHPVAGDWNDDGIDTIGVFNRPGTQFLLRNSNTQGNPDIVLSFGFTDSIPLAGDWDGDGIDTIGVFRWTDNTFHLRNSNTSGPADIVVQFGIGSVSPVVGDWNGDGNDTIGVFDRTDSVLQLRNSNTPGPPDVEVPVRTARWPWTPIAGNWHVPAEYPAEPGYPWPTSIPKAENINPTLLAAAYDQAARNRSLYSLLVIRHGKLVAEQYFGGMTRGVGGNVKSVSKSILNALVGQAIATGHFSGVNQTIESVVPWLFEGQSDPRKSKITIGHQITMTTALAWDESNLWPWFFGGDPHQFVIDQPLTHDPGNVFRYSTGSTHLMARMIKEASGKETPDFAATHLFTPLGIAPQRWDVDPLGDPIGGAEVYLTPRDMARFGELYLRDGNLQGAEIVPALWIDYSTDERVPQAWVGGGNAYGAWWWRRVFGDQQAYFAWGYGGQFIFIFDDLDLVIVASSDWTVSAQQSGAQANAVFNLIRQSILPAINPDPASASLTSLILVTGTLLDGDVPELYRSDNAYVHTRSGFGSTLIDIHNLEMRISATTEVQSPAKLDIMFESRINQPAGIAQIRLLNHNTQQFDIVGQYALGSTDAINTIPDIDATNYVNVQGDIELSIKHIVFVPFLAFTFESFIDHAKIVAE